MKDVFFDSKTPTRDAVRTALLANLPDVLQQLLPNGEQRGTHYFVGDVNGNPGNSLDIVLEGPKAGLWTDRATGDGGDIFTLIADVQRLNVRTDFARVLEHAQTLVNIPTPLPPTTHASKKSDSQPTPNPEKKSSKKPSKKAPKPDLGPATGRWNYLDDQGDLLAIVYRYDPPSGKTFIPWDAKRRKATPPQPRPLYNQPELRNADQVVLVEGEKCAQALIEYGIVATTAMQGANAPVEKTDWSPLKNKIVLIWPDNDDPGWEYAKHASDALLKIGARRIILLVPPQDKPKAWDAADAIAEGFDVRGFITAGERIPVTHLSNSTPPSVLFHGLDWMSEDGLASAFTRRYGEDWRYVAVWNKWFVWTGQRWNPDHRLYVSHVARSICRAASELTEGRRYKSRLAAASTLSGILTFTKSDPVHAAGTEEWDVNPWALNTTGGVIYLNTGRKTPHNRDERMTKITTATPQGKCPQWLAFLADITGNQPELIAYLQRMVGYCLTGITTEHALFFLYGTGANGKSVFLNVISTILGDYAVSAPIDTFMESRNERHPTELASLRGARLVTSIETEQGRRWNEAKVKTITGGDKIAARFMRQDFFEYLPQFKLVIAGNHKPSIRNVDEAMRRRLHLIPFTVTIPPERRDGKMTEKLLGERDGILAWGIDGCDRWRHEGLNPPPSVLAATEDYFESEDALGQWIDERCVHGRAYRTPVADLYADWRDWAEKAGEFAGSIKRFSEVMTNRKFAKCRVGDGVRGIAHIGLRPNRSSFGQGYIDEE